MKQLYRIVLLLGLVSSSIISNPTTSPSSDIEATTQGLLLHEDYKLAFSHLDEITGTLEYLGQVVNKGAIKEHTKKREVRLWILEQFALIKELMLVPEHRREAHLVEMLRIVRAHLIYLTTTIQNNFDTLLSFEKPVIEEPISQELSHEQATVIYRTIGQLLEGNGHLITQMNTAIKHLGLSTTNLWARWLDDVNDKWKITATLEKVPRYVALAAAAMYLIPYKHFEYIPGMSWLKRKIGTTDYWDPAGFKDIQWYGREAERPAPPVHPAAKPNGTIAEFLNGPDRKAFLSIAAGAAYLVWTDPLAEYIESFKKYLRPRWNKLKGFNLPRLNQYRHPDITLDDPRLIGLDSQISQMKNIVRYITEPETFDRSASGLEKGILLTGPSRSGKTLLANALCGSINDVMQKKGMTKKFAFKQIKWSDVRWQNDGIKSILEDAKRNAPCVLFLDELHNLPLQVKEGGEVLTQFLTMSESLQSTGLRDAVIILAATNRPYALDDALLKPGRFGLQIHFENPTFELRKKFFKTMCEYNAINPESFDIDQLARLTEQCSYGELDMIFKSARFIARHDKRALQQQDFLHNIYEQVYRIRFDQTVPLTDEAHRLVATHQAGHALLHMLYERHLNQRLEVVTTRGQWAEIQEKRFLIDDVHTAHVQKKTDYGHLFVSHPSEAVDVGAAPEIKAKMLLAGTLAEELLIGSTTRSYHAEDTQEAQKLLENYLLKGRAPDTLSKQELQHIKQQASALLRSCEKEVRELLTQEQSALKNISMALQEKLLLTYDEIKELMR